MPYLALYRKWRPATFDEVRGQDAIVQTLRNQIIYNRIGHAYLFCGTRGTGKTSVAKLFARAVNCQNPQNGNPCNECPSCRAINSGNSLDVYEIDAASNNGVENIRELRDQITYTPVEGRYKVYIIDEVHMLSKSAFNALLKTLEEPPSYVIFILATTEKQQVPITILSRCQQYDFRRISLDTISAHLADLMDREHVEVEKKALRYIARAADGSMRDALSLLDQCISFYLGQTLTYEKVLSVLGASDTTVFSSLLQSIERQDTGRVLKLIEDIITEGRDLSQFLNDFLWYLRNLLILQDQDGSEESLEMSREAIEVLRKEAKQIGISTLLRYIRNLSALSTQIRTATQKRILMEVAFIRLCRPEMEPDTESLTSRIELLERKLSDVSLAASAISAASAASEGQPPLDSHSPGAASGKEPSATAKAGSKKQAPRTAEETSDELKHRFGSGKAADLEKIMADWDQVAAAAPDMMRQALPFFQVSVAEEPGALLLSPTEQPDASFDPVLSYFLDQNHVRELEEIIERETGQTIKVIYLNRPVTSGKADSVIVLDPLSSVKKKVHFQVEVE